MGQKPYLTLFGELKTAKWVRLCGSALAGNCGIIWGRFFVFIMIKLFRAYVAISLCFPLQSGRKRISFHISNYMGEGANCRGAMPSGKGTWSHRWH